MGKYSHLDHNWSSTDAITLNDFVPKSSLIWKFETCLTRVSIAYLSVNGTARYEIRISNYKLHSIKREGPVWNSKVEAGRMCRPSHSCINNIRVSGTAICDVRILNYVLRSIKPDISNLIMLVCLTAIKVWLMLSCIVVQFESIDGVVHKRLYL